MKYNPQVMERLPVAPPSETFVECFLAEYADGTEAAGARLWTFLYNPSVLQFSREARYAEAATYGTKTPDQQYQYTSGETLELPNLTLDAWWEGCSIQPLLDGIDALMEVKADAENLSPPILSLVMGARRFGPCVLTRVQRTEAGWLAGGAPARAQVSLTLLEIPKEKLSDPAEAVAITPDETAAAEGRPRLPLTERQRRDASTEAKRYLQENAARFSPEIMALIQSNNYLLATDEASGDVTMYSSDRAALGVVIRWDGQQATTQRPPQTLPLAPAMM
jgi:phage protein U